MPTRVVKRSNDRNINPIREMQMEESVNGSGISPSGRVQDIRRQWAVQEDEALATRLQDEEIIQHYAGNRSRNAIVREDGPRAREEQRREEQEAVELRLKHLSLLQRQAEDDARVAQELAKRYQEGCPDATLRVLKGGAAAGGVVRRMEEEMRQKQTPSSSTSPPKDTRDASNRPSTSQASLGAASVLHDDSSDELDEEDLKLAQERRDGELAKKVQEEMERYERDRLLAIEAQDRELAKLLHEKEKARLKRAKERARQKAEAAAAAAAQNGQGTLENGRQSDSSPSEEPHPLSSEQMLPPPIIPQKSSSASSSAGSSGGFLGFRAAPKALPQSPTPPHSPSHHHPFVLRPHSSSSPGTSSSSSSVRSAAIRDFSNDPIPPYMPLNGFQRSTPPPKRPPK